MSGRHYRDTGRLQSEFAAASEAIQRRLQEFAAVADGDLFYELAYCLLTPQSSAAHAEAAVQELRAMAFRENGGDPMPVLRTPERYIRFHRTKARRLMEVRARSEELLATLRGNRSRPSSATQGGPGMRLWLVQEVRGMGWKEASHFLRNIGYRNLAILDRHILKNLLHHGVLETIPASLTPRRYTAIEAAFQEFAAAVGITLDELDLLFWSRETGEIRK